MIALAVQTFAGCGSPRTTADDKSLVEEGVALYIAGDYAAAEVLFEKILDEPDSDEDLVTAHLYLGRIYLAENEYQKAANVLSAGKALGGDIRFDEYFEIAASHLRTSSSQVLQEDVISRGQLASLLEDMFGDALGGGQHARTQVDSIGTQKSEAHVRFAETAGIMKTLPDGGFHEEAGVTRPSFFVVVSRLTDRLGLSADVVAAVFPGGIRQAVGTGDDEQLETDVGKYVSGREAVTVLDRVAIAADI